MFRTSLLMAAALAASASSASAVTVNTVNGNTDSGLSLVTSLLGPSSGLTVTGTSYIGAATQAGTYSGFNLVSSDAGEPTLTLDNGILLTSGNAAIPSSNTSTAFSTSTGTGSNALVDATLAGAPTFDGTRDQNVLSFTFTVDDPATTSVSTKFVFGSEEYPEFPGFADSFTFFVDGTNYAFFPGNIPIIQTGATQALFVANNTNGSYGIEYDGLSNVLTLIGILDPNKSVHEIIIVVADDADQILDSGVFLASLTAGTDTGGGGIDPNPVPLPASLPLFLAAIGGLGFLRRKTRR
jgi:hypothetical protein